MRKSLAFAALIFCLWGCNSKTENTIGSQDSTSTHKAGTENGVMALGGNEKYDAVVIGAGVRARQSPNTKGEVLRSFAQGELVKVLETKTEREVASKGGECDAAGYPWVKVQDHEGKESWIFGKFLFKFQQMRSEKGRVTGGQDITLSGKTYRFHLAVDMSRGPLDEKNEVTACEVLYTPLLFSEDSHQAILFYVDPKKVTEPHIAEHAHTFDTNLLILVAETKATKDMVESVEARSKEPVLDLKLSHHFEEGSTESRMVIRVAKERADVVEFHGETPSM